MVVTTLVAALLFSVAFAGAMVPYMRPRAITLERLSDPLDDERRSAMRSLRELQDELDSGSLSEDNYRGLRAAAELRAVDVLRRVAARDGEELRGSVKQIREPSASKGSRLSGGRRGAVVLLTAAVATAWAVTILGSSVLGRTAGAPITGDLAPSASPGDGADPMAFFEQRVQAHPDDVAARLDLARRYLDSANIRDAITQYLVAVKLDPTNVEANANLGLVLALVGRPKEGLTQVERALTTDPTYPEGLYIKGYILVRALDRPQQAVIPLRTYLRVAPFGAERAIVKQLLDHALQTGTPLPTTTSSVG